MTTYNKKTPARNRGKSPVKTDKVPTGTTFEGHPGYSRDPKSELFITAVSTFGEQDTFYEKRDARRERIVRLTAGVTLTDPVWMLRFVRWLRNEANIRTVALVIGLEAAKAVTDLAPGVKFMGEAPGVDKEQGLARQLAKAGISRADEPGEAMAYWANTYGGAPGGGIKRAIADKAVELYNERNLLKYDTNSHGFRFGDVIELCHPRPKTPWQDDLFRYAIERRHNRGLLHTTSLDMLKLNALLRERAEANDYLSLLDPENLRLAGMTWEDVLSLAGSKLDKKLLWESMIPSMGYMALLRNLRNFDQAGVSDDHARFVMEVLTKPEAVAKSRQLPMRFLSAYQNAPSLRWSWPLEQALQLSLSNVPKLDGNTLILVDTSSSMNAQMSDRSQLKRWGAASLFGLALAQRCQVANVVSFAGTSRNFMLPRGQSLLTSFKTWEASGFNMGGGTNTVQALREHVKNSTNRVVIVTDEQASGGYDAYGRRRYGYGLDQEGYLNEVNSVVPTSIPLHVINVAGYKQGMVPSGSQNRHVYGGLTDQVFKLIPLVERGQNGQWPWES